MANKKKKKAVANPARGFATVSQPSKAKDVVQDEDVPANQIPSMSANGSKIVSGHLSMPSASDEASKSHIQDMTPAELEAHLAESDLRNIINTYGVRCRQDVVRQVGRLETERRQLRLQLHTYKLATASWFSEALLDELISMHGDSLIAKTSPQVGNQNVPNEEAMLVSLWTLKRTLVALKVPDVDSAVEYVIDRSLTGKLESSDYIWGLAEALEWYAVRSKQYGLQGYEDVTPLSVVDGSSSSDTCCDSEDEIHPPGNKNDPIPKVQEGAHTSDFEDIELSDLPSSGSDDDDPVLFVEQYCRLKSSLFRLEWKMKQHTSQKMSLRKSVLMDRINKLTRDPLFDKGSAENLWRPRLRDLEIEAAQIAQRDRRQIDSEAKIHQDGDDIGDADGADEDILAAMFAGDDQDVSMQSANESQTVQIVDFGNWTGAAPRRILEDACNGIQSPTTIRVGTISSSSFSIRKNLQLTLASTPMIDIHDSLAIPSSLKLTVKRGTIKLEMNSIATKTPLQADSYLSTIMLFVLSAMNLSDQKQHHRLPSTWRNLYQQLNDDQKQLENNKDIVMLKNLRSVLEKAVAETTAEKRPGADPAQVSKHTDALSVGRLRMRSDETDADHIKALWRAKSSTTAFQTILLDREQLPVYRYKHHVLTAIEQNQVVIVCADTGAGKSTQIPSFLLEHELSHGRDCHIIVTQPRRISAISLAKRVSKELGERPNDIGTNRSLVGYAIRLESKTCQETRITYATTGVLLRMLESSPELGQINCLVLDEVHERTMDLDLLFIAIQKLQSIRKGLKIILMSATVDAVKFSRYFANAPIIDIPGRTFPVEVKFLEDAVEETLHIRHGKIPTHASEQSKFESAQSSDHSSSDNETTINSQNPMEELTSYSAATQSIITEMDEHRIDFELVADVAVVIATKPEYQMYSAAILIFVPGIAEIRRLQSILLSREVFARGWVVHLLHSSFSTDDLEKAFIIPPQGQRKIVISTNIAETGITIPDVTAVIDTCKEKIMRFDERRQVSKLREGFISRSSARQRKGRAARVQEGLCFHLVTRSRFLNSMLEQHVPEMLRLSLQDAILRVKVWNLGSIEETLAAAIDPPTSKNVRRAISKLKDAGALSSAEELTPLGRQLSKLPLEVVLGKLAIYGIIFRCLDSILTIVAAISSKSPFQSSREGNSTNHRAAFARGDSDLISTLNAYEGWQRARQAGTVHAYCRKHFLNHQSLVAIDEQKGQLVVNLVDAGLLHLSTEEKTSLRNSRGTTHRRQGFEVPARFNACQHDLILCTIMAVAFHPRILAREGRGWRNVYSNQQMNLATSSVNRSSEKPPRWLCFYEAMQSKSGAVTVLETSRIPEAALATVIGSEATFKFFSGIIDIDNGKLRFSVGDWRQMAALKAIRQRLRGAVNRFLETPGAEVPAEDEVWMRSWMKLVTGQPLKNM